MPVNMIIMLPDATQPEQRVRLADYAAHHFIDDCSNWPKIPGFLTGNGFVQTFKRNAGVLQQVFRRLRFTLQRGDGLMLYRFTYTQRRKVKFFPAFSSAPAFRTEGRGRGFGKRNGIPGFCNVDRDPLAVGYQSPDVILRADVKALNGERGLMPRPIKIGHKHANLQILHRDFSLTDAHVSLLNTHFRWLPFLND